MKKYLRFTALCLCVAMLAGCGGKKAPEGMMQEEETATSVEIENPTINTIKDEYMYSGTIQAAETVDVSAKVSGTVEKTNFEVGDKVKKGDVLFTIDDTDYQNSLKSAEAALASAKTGVESAQNGITSAKTSVDTANGATMKTQLQSAENNITNCKTALETAQKSLQDCDIAITNAQTSYNKAKSDYDMYKQLFDVGGTSADTLETYRISLETAENTLSTAQNSKTKAELSVKSAEDALSQAQQNYDTLYKDTQAENARKANDTLTSAKTSLKSAQNSVSTAQVAVDNAKQQVSYCTVTAPCDGTILTKNAVEGSIISGVGYQIVDLNSVDVQVNASEQIATSVNTGDAVTIVIPSLDNLTTTGSITSIPPSANSDGTYTIKIKIPNSEGKLKGGMFTQIYFAKSTSDAAVIVPRDAVIEDTDGSYVFVKNGDVCKKVDVTTGIDTGTTIELTSGVTINDKVIVKGQTYLADGDKINVVSDNGVDVEVTTQATTASEQDGKGKPKEDKK